MLRTLFFAALAAVPALALADPPAGEIDPTFADSVVNNGIAGLQLVGFNVGQDWDDIALTMVADAQGRLIVAGGVETDGESCIGLMRFTPKGELDKTEFGFDTNHVPKGKICHATEDMPQHVAAALGDLLDDTFSAAALPDGGILFGGRSSGGSFVCRFLADGSIKESFGDGTGCVALPQSGVVRPPVLLADGESALVIASYNEGFPQKTVPKLTRISLQSGEIEPFADQESIPLLSSTESASSRDAILTSDGDIIIVGNVLVGDSYDSFVARFDLQLAQPDDSFGDDGIVILAMNPSANDKLLVVASAPNGDIIAAGEVGDADDNPDDVSVVQLNVKNGALSPAFNQGHAKVYDACPGGEAQDCNSVRDIGLTAGYVTLSGTTTIPGGITGSLLWGPTFVSRIKITGDVDTSFGDQGTVILDIDPAWKNNPTPMLLQGERVVFAGTARNGSGDDDFALLRLSDGRLFNDQFESETP